jgi:microcystin degradation protein MlrC
VGDAVVQGPVDAAAVARCCEAGVGAEVELSIGGKLDHVHAQPLAVRGTVVAVSAEETTYTFDASAGTSNPPEPRVGLMPPAAVVAVQPSAVEGTGAPPPSILVTLTAARKAFHYAASFRQLSVDISSHRILAVKMGYLVPDLAQRAALNLMALTPGAVFADLVTLQYERVHRPFFPQDPHMSWTARLAMPWTGPPSTGSGAAPKL